MIEAKVSRKEHPKRTSRNHKSMWEIQNSTNIHNSVFLNGTQTIIYIKLGKLQETWSKNQ